MSSDNSEGSSPQMLDSLPDRPLTMEEGEAIAGDNITPLSILVAEDGASASVSIYTIWAISEKKEKSWVLGYSDSQDGWTVIDEWDEEEWDFEEQEERVQEWISEEHGDKLDTQGTIDPTNDEIELEDAI